MSVYALLAAYVLGIGLILAVTDEDDRDWFTRREWIALIALWPLAVAALPFLAISDWIGDIRAWRSVLARRPHDSETNREE